jgi:hypothetical protein
MYNGAGFGADFMTWHILSFNFNTGRLLLQQAAFCVFLRYNTFRTFAALPFLYI